MNLNINYYILDFLMLFMILIPSNLYKFHPLIFNILLFFYTILICFKLNYLMSNFFYSYILFLMMVGGVMILIMYFTSISNNELLTFSKNYLIYLILKYLFMMIMLFFFMYLIYSNYLNYYLKNFDLINMYNVFKDNQNFMLLKNMYMYMNMEVTIFFILYLLLMMMFSTMICLKFNIPMRQMKN